MFSSSSAFSKLTSYSNSSATIVSVSASRRWFIVTIIPRVMQVEIISVEDTFIIVAISPTVMNSVTLRILLSASI